MTGIWMWSDSLAAIGAEKAVSLCCQAGITDVFFLAKGLSGRAAFAGSEAPACADGRDLLGELLEPAHRRGVRVHAWLASGWDDHYRAAHPESGRAHYVRGRDKGLISLADPGYQDYLRRIIGSLCVRYEIDGLHLDYIRYNHLLYGWDDRDRARYAAAGADPVRLKELMERTFLSESPDDTYAFDAYRAGDPSALALAKARRADVVRFARGLCGAAKEARPGLTLSAALMPEGAYKDTAFSDLHYGQNYEDAAKLYDFVVPMAYAREYGQDSGWVREVAEESLRRGLKTVVGLFAPEGKEDPLLQADLSALKGVHADGVCYFRFGTYFR